MDEDIASVMNVRAWEPVDEVLCTLARRIREEDPERKLSVVAPVALQHFIDYLPPVSFITGLRRLELTMCLVGRIFPRHASINSDAKGGT